MSGGQTAPVCPRCGTTYRRIPHPVLGWCWRDDTCDSELLTTDVERGWLVSEPTDYQQLDLFR